MGAALEREALNLPWTPGFLHKHGGWCFPWVNSAMGRRAGASTGSVQIWPGTPVSQALVENGKWRRLPARSRRDQTRRARRRFHAGHGHSRRADRGGRRPGWPGGRQLDDLFGLPENHRARDWAVGMKFVVDLPEDTPLKAGTVLHTFGIPSRKSSDSSTSIPAASLPSASSSRRGSTARCARPTATFNTG